MRGSFFKGSAGGRTNPLHSSLNQTFDKYRNDVKHEPDVIGINGTSTLLEELEIDISDVGALVLSEVVQSPSLGNITREGWMQGWTEYGVDTLPKMRNVVLQRRSQLATDLEVLKSVYNHTFVLGLQERQKALPLDVATAFWRLIFVAPSFEWGTAQTPWLDWWIEYNEEKVKKAVNKDLWKQTLTFAVKTVQDDSLSFWNEESSWPSIIDEFVGWVRGEKQRGGTDAMEVS